MSNSDSNPNPNPSEKLHDLLPLPRLKIFLNQLFGKDGANLSAKDKLVFLLNCK